VYYKKPATGPHAGEYLQPPLTLPRPTVSKLGSHPAPK
jgi:hypothetical protein